MTEIRIFKVANGWILHDQSSKQLDMCIQVNPNTQYVYQTVAQLCEGLGTLIDAASKKSGAMMVPEFLSQPVKP